MWQRNKARAVIVNRTRVALVIGAGAGIGTGLAMNSDAQGIVLSVALGVAVFLIFGLEFS